MKSCAACSMVVKDERIHPLKKSDLPDRPCQSLSADFGGPYPSGHYCLVVTDEIRLHDAKHKEEQEQYADRRNGVRPHDSLSVGNVVLVRQRKHNKLTPAYNPEPLVVEQVKRNMLTATNVQAHVRSRCAEFV